MDGPHAAPDPADESQAAIPERYRDSRLLRTASRALQLVCLVYAVFLLFWIWLAKGLAVGLLLSDPVFYTYSLLVTIYCLARFFLAPFYRPTPDTGYRPTASIVIPAFNEEDCVGLTIDACYGTDYPADRLEVVAVDDGSTDRTWERILEARERPRSRFDRRPHRRALRRRGRAFGRLAGEEDHTEGVCRVCSPATRSGRARSASTIAGRRRAT